MTDHLFTDREQLSQDCRHCGKPFSYFKPYRGRHPVCCSDECRKQRQRQQVREWEPPLERRIRRPRVHTVKAERPVRYCHSCLKPHQRVAKAVFCSDDCRRDMKLYVRRSRGYTSGHHGLVTKNCRACGAPFQCRTDNDRYICSDECRADWIRMKGPRPSFSLYRKAPGQWEPISFDHLYPEHDFSRSKVRRLKIRITTIERINPIKVLNRDGWVCQLCGKDTPKALRGMKHDDAPEVDHIIPLAKGGRHVYGNLQCACRRCNMSKSDRLHYKSMISMS